jgi:hypothetical protein
MTRGQRVAHQTVWRALPVAVALLVSLALMLRYRGIQ